jgi:hypothetical protein
VAGACVGAGESLGDAGVDATLPADAIASIPADAIASIPADAIASIPADATSPITRPDAVAPPPSDLEAGAAGRVISAACAEDSDCASGFCVEGVCCGSRCDGLCQSCTLPGSVGACTPEPLGVDFRAQCGPARACVSTCDGAGHCIGAGVGTLCTRNACVDASHGVGAAICSGFEGTCETASAAPFDCTPYACAAAFGACVSRCATSDDCAPGYVCDTSSGTSSGTCTQPTSQASGGCTFAGGPTRDRSRSAALALVILAICARSRRRSARS